MGGGTWTTMAYNAVTRSKIDSGTTFVYTATSKASGRYEAHENLRVLDSDGKPFTRESRDSDEHPESTPIVVGFDVTGSMGENPAILQKCLCGLFGMLIRRDIVSDPQIAIAAYGDTHCDRVPLQMSQFESDNRIDDNLDNVFVEGGGGGNLGETSTALAWYVARHVVTDAWEKRGKRGYMFLIGDECALPVTREQSSEYLGEDEPHEITPEMAFGEAMEKWDTYFLLVKNYASEMQQSERKYEDLLGKDHVIPLQSTDSAPAVIAAVIALAEGTTDPSSLKEELSDSGFSIQVADQAVSATAGLSKSGEAGLAGVSVDDGYGDLAL